MGVCEYAWVCPGMHRCGQVCAGVVSVRGFGCVCECARVCMGEHGWVNLVVYAGVWVSAGVYECVCGYARVCTDMRGCVL